MPQLFHVNPQLVRASGQWRQRDAGGGPVPFDHFPLGLAGLAVHVIHLLQRTVGPVTDQRQINHTLVQLRLAQHLSLVEFAHGPLAELALELRQCIGGQREQQDAAGVHIQSMHHVQVLAQLLFKPRQGAVLVRLLAARDAQQPGRFVDGHPALTSSNDRRCLHRRRVDKGWRAQGASTAVLASDL